MKLIRLCLDLKVELSIIFQLRELSYLELCLGKESKQWFIDTCPYLKLCVGLGLGM